MTTQAPHADPAAHAHPGAVGTALASPHRRRNYLIDPKTQYAITRQFMMVLAVGCGLSVANYHAFRTVLVAGVPDSLELTLAYAYCAGLLLISVSLLMMMCVFYSHRIAGPARKIAQAMDRLANRNLCLTIRLRETDLLVELADAVNAATRDLRTAMREVESELRRARTLPAGSQEQHVCLQRAENLLAGFQITTAAERDACEAASRAPRGGDNAG